MALSRRLASRTEARAAPAAPADRGIVGVGDGLVDRGRLFDLGHQDAAQAHVEVASDQVGVPGVRDAKLDRQSQLLGQATEGHQLVVAEGRVLAVEVDQVVAALGQRRFEPTSTDGDRRPQGDDDLTIFDALLQRRGRGHLSRSSCWPLQAFAGPLSVPIGAGRNGRDPRISPPGRRPAREPASARRRFASA